MFSFLYYLRVKINSILKNKLTNIILYSVIIISAFSRVSSQEIYFPLEEDSIVKKLILQKNEIDSEEYESNYYTIQLYYGNYLIAKEILDEFKNIF